MALLGQVSVKLVRRPDPGGPESEHGLAQADAGRETPDRQRAERPESIPATPPARPLPHRRLDHDEAMAAVERREVARLRRDHAERQGEAVPVRDHPRPAVPAVFCADGDEAVPEARPQARPGGGEHGKRARGRPGGDRFGPSST